MKCSEILDDYLFKMQWDNHVTAQHSIKCLRKTVKSQVRIFVQVEIQTLRIRIAH
jgi:hypothetical protein